jgi:hypothetical protein
MIENIFLLLIFFIPLAMIFALFAMMMEWMDGYYTDETLARAGLRGAFFAALIMLAIGLIVLI